MRTTGAWPRGLQSDAGILHKLADFTHAYGSISQNASAVNGFVYFARNDANLWLPPQLDVKDWSAGGKTKVIISHCFGIGCLSFLNVTYRRKLCRRSS